MINTKIQLLALFIAAFSVSLNAVEQSQHTTQQTKASPAKAEIPTETGGTYRDEVEIIKFDENTGRDSYAIPFDEEALEPRQKTNPATTK